MTTKYWRSIEERDVPQEPHEIDDGRDELGRRDFLKTAGFSLAAVAVAGCTRPQVGKAIPFLQAPEEIVPGKPYWIASTCHGCAARCGVLVKCRDGRPIKLEGNPDHPVSRGGLCAVGQATVLELYDSQRLAGPQLGGKPSEWKSVDAYVAAKLASAKRVRVVSTTLASPAASRVIGNFLSKFDDGRHVEYDVLSADAIATAHAQTDGTAVIPRYRFERASVIASFDADFLGTWISPVEYTRGWSERRDGSKSMSWHVQLEPRMSLTGSKADQRLRLHPRDRHAVLHRLASLTGAPEPACAGHPRGALANAVVPFKDVVLQRIASRLTAARGESLVVCGSNDVDDQLVVNAVNRQLGNYGTTIDTAAPSNQRRGSDAARAELRDELRAGNVDALFVLDANPVYDLPYGDELAKVIAAVPLVVSFASHPDETSAHAHVIAPDHHFLESWRDSEPVSGVYAVTQPAIAPLRNTRSYLESFAAWSGAPAEAYDIVKTQNIAGDWDRAVHDGATSVLPILSTPSVAAKSTLPAPLVRNAGTNTFTPILYASIAMLDGRHALNPWLHELPDPIAKVTWDNFASLSPADAKRLGVTDGDGVVVSGGNESVDLPAFVQPGQQDGVVAVAHGYGRAGTQRFAKTGPQWLQRRTLLAPGEPVGRRAVQLTKYEAVTITKSGKRHELATTQLHNTMETPKELGDIERPAPVHETKLNGAAAPAEALGEHPEEATDLWPAKAKGPHQWGLAIDLTRCSGCSACVIACQAENNVPVVGKDEVLREREMHWIRIDRYYSGEGDDVTVAHQPMMCAHCGNAPCETVCPVLATVHSSEGLNQQVYNRCVGTRYCANNCPYKVRRFNWFDYPHEDRFANLVLNPDVAVRSRGVMEKCSMCVQRIENARIEAKAAGVPIAEGAIRTACQQSCPASAIVFGDLADPKSRVSRMRKDPRHYLVLEELNVRPAVGYMTLVRNA